MAEERQTHPQLLAYIADFKAKLKEVPEAEVDAFLISQFEFIQADAMELSAKLADGFIQWIGAKTKLGQLPELQFKLQASAAVIIASKIRENKPGHHTPPAANDDAKKKSSLILPVDNKNIISATFEKKP